MESEGQSELARNISQLANDLLDSDRAGDFNQAMMELGATVCLPKNPQCLTCPISAACQTRGEHPTPVRARMRSQDAAYALVVRSHHKHREVLLDQRGTSRRSCPACGSCLRSVKPTLLLELRMTVRHAIMQVNYYVRIRTVFEDDAEALTVPSECRRWIRLLDLDTLPLTGLARKVLLRAGLPELTPNLPVLDSAAAD
jgi:A/G-specific adenine glycosylase